MNKSPSGSLSPYYYMGGELHPLKYGSFYNNKTALLTIIQEEEAFILASAGTLNRNIWIDLYRTRLDAEVIHELVRHMQAIAPKTRKLCLVGCSSITRMKVLLCMKKQAPALLHSVAFFQDPETAKRWLIKGNT